jgi:N-acetylmuramoyl-L-alanine amidase
MLRKLDKIILHCSATKDSGTVSWQAIRRYHIQECAWRDIGYHFGIELVNDQYEVLMGRPLTEVGSHCQGHNSTSIGICFVGDFEQSPPPAAQWQAGLKLVTMLLNVFRLDSHAVFGHREFNRHKTCPGTCFDMEKFRKELMDTGGVP